VVIVAEHHNTERNLRILVSNTISIKDVFVLFSTNMTGAKGGTGTAYSSGAPELKPTFFH
jgi:hypothetical protein